MARVHFGHHSTMHLTPERKKVLVYARDSETPAYKALEKKISTRCDRDKIVVSSELESELRTGQYGLVIDVLAVDEMTMSHQVLLNRRFLLDAEKISSLDDTVKIDFATNPSTLIFDIGRKVADYFRSQESGGQE